MVFRVPLESSPPSTPNKSRSFFSQGSTTPAGAPPSSARSFTPHGAPSSSTHGRSSRAGHRPANGLNESLFSMSGGMENDSIFMSSVASSDYPVPRKKQHESTNGAFAAPQSLFGPKKQARFGQPMNFGVSNGFGDSQMSGGQHEEEYDDEDMNTDEDDAVSEMVTEEPDGAAEAADDGVEEDAEERETNDLLFLDSVVGRANPVRQPTPGRRKSIYTNPDNAKRPKLDEQWAQRTPAGAANSHLQNSSLPAIARDLAARSTVAGVDEPSDVIIRTEDEICRMWDEGRRREYDDVNFDLILSEVSQDLTDIWQSSVEKAAGGRLHGAVTDIGPGENAPKFAKASFVASLLLRIHHPSTPPSARAGARFRPASQSLVQASLQTPDLIEPVPKVLLDWINTSHASRSIDLLSLGEVEPNPTASASFWDLIKTGALRGQLGDVVKILQSSDFKYARSALEDGLPQVGYRGVQLQNIQRCVNKAWQLLESSPVVQNDNWNVTGREWAVYRQRISAALADLEDFAEGQDRRLPSASAAAKGDRFQAPNFGLTSANAASNKFSFAQSARIAESHVPWAIYQSLKALYLILLGDKSAIMACSQDWVEATLALTAWWDGEDDSELTMPGPGPGGFSGRASHNLRNVGIRYVDHRPGSAYLERLLIAFSTVTDPSTEGSFRLNSMSSLEVALASIFQGNIDGVLQILQTWSLCIASAVVEIAAAGGWFISAGAGATAGRGRGAQALSNQLSENDLMVLSYGQDGQSGAVSHDAFRRDDVLVAYAAGLSARPFVENDSGTREGWEIALEVLSRLEDTETMEKGVADLLDKLPLDTAEQVDKLVLLCAELGFDKEGRRVSERFGDLLSSRTDEFGRLLVYYARARNRRKVKNVVDLLISHSLVQSRAFPAREDLDEQLRLLIANDQAGLSALASVDEEAAKMLHPYLTGYTMVRRFYTIRDEAIGEQPRHKPLARRRAAAQALVRVIESAKDSIYGGLYDPARDSAVQVDGLLTLLGEALVFVYQPQTILSMSQQFTILSAIEDLETVTPRVFAQCEGFFRASMDAYHSGTGSGAEPRLPSARALLKKSLSALTASSTFSLIGSEMLESSARARSASGGSASADSTTTGVLVARPHEEQGRKRDRNNGISAISTTTTASASASSGERGWDWRAGLSHDAKGKDVLRALRTGLSKTLSFAALGSV